MACDVPLHENDSTVTVAQPPTTSWHWQKNLQSSRSKQHDVRWFMRTSRVVLFRMSIIYIISCWSWASLDHGEAMSWWAKKLDLNKICSHWSSVFYFNVFPKSIPKSQKLRYPAKTTVLAGEIRAIAVTLLLSQDQTVQHLLCRSPFSGLWTADFSGSSHRFFWAQNPQTVGETLFWVVMMVKYGEVSEGKSHQIPDIGGISLIFDGEIPIFEVASNFKLWNLHLDRTMPGVWLLLALLQQLRIRLASQMVRCVEVNWRFCGTS